LRLIFPSVLQVCGFQLEKMLNTLLILFFNLYDYFVELAAAGVCDSFPAPRICGLMVKQRL
jgi:hypothetical protein